MSIPVPRAPKTRFTAPARAVPAPEEVSAGGLIIDFDRPEQLPVAIIARINRNGTTRMVPTQRPHRTRRNHRRSRTTRNQRRNRNHRLPRSLPRHHRLLVHLQRHAHPQNRTPLPLRSNRRRTQHRQRPRPRSNRRRLGPLEELPTRLSFANEQHIARSARIHHHPALNTRCRA